MGEGARRGVDGGASRRAGDDRPAIVTELFRKERLRGWIWGGQAQRRMSQSTRAGLASASAFTVAVMLVVSNPLF